MKAAKKTTTKKNKSVCRWLTTGILIMLAGLILGCQYADSYNDNDNDEPQNTPSTTEKTSIVIYFSGSSYRSVMAAEEDRITRITSYHITISDPDGNIHYDDVKPVSAQPLVIDKLPIGEITFVISALDSENIILANGSATITLTAGINNIKVTLMWESNESPGIIIIEKSEAEVIIDIEIDDGFAVLVDILDSIQNIGFSSLDSAFDWIEENAIDNGNYTVRLKKNEKIKGRVFDYNDKLISITLISFDGIEKQISYVNNWGWNLFDIMTGVTLILDQGITLKDPDNYYFECVPVSVKGKLIMKSGSAIKKEKTDEGWGWMGVVVAAAGEFIMDGGHIDGNNSGSSGIVVGGHFTMNNGLISGGCGSLSDFGSGVIVSSGASFVMNGGSITGNNAYEGGGVYVRPHGEFTMNGGAISNNNAGLGGGVYVQATNFIMNGGTISNNTASSGGGVYHGWGAGKFTMSGGTISGNISHYQVYILMANFIKTGGIIFGNDGTTNANEAINDSGHAVIAKQANSDSAFNVRMESTAGPEARLVFNYDALPIADGDWDYFPSYTVTFDSTGGHWNGDTAGKLVTTNITYMITPPENPMHEGRSFEGWYAHPIDGTEFDFSMPVTSSITLYARWRFHLPLTNVDDVMPYLASNQSDEHLSSMGLYLPMQIDLGDMTLATSDWWKLLESIYFSKKAYLRVDLDLSACTMSGTEFRPGYFPGTLFYNPERDATGTYLNAWNLILKITLPDAVESISGGWYKSGWGGGNGPQLKHFSAKNLKSIGSYSFGPYFSYDCSNIEYIDTPALTSIDDKAFYLCTNLKVIRLGAVPPILVPDAFIGTSQDLLIKVPEASVSAYKNDTTWRLYANYISGY